MSTNILRTMHFNMCARQGARRTGESPETVRQGERYSDRQGRPPLGSFIPVFWNRCSTGNDESARPEGMIGHFTDFRRV